MSSGQPDRRSLGDAGEVLDGAARTAYRHRIEALRADADDALAEGRLDEAEACQAELDLLVLQLAQAFGLGGRSRVAGSAAERARLNVTRARAVGARPSSSRPSRSRGPRSTGGSAPASTAPTSRRDGEIRWIVQS